MTVAILTGEDIPLQKDNTNDRSPDEHTIVTEVLPSTAPVQPGLRTIFPILELEDHPIDQTKQIKVVVVGAGIAGITAGILLPRKVPNIDLTILDRHDDIVLSELSIEKDTDKIGRCMACQCLSRSQM